MFANLFLNNSAVLFHQGQVSDIQKIYLRGYIIMKERIRKSVIGFAVMGVLAASGLLALPSVSEAGVNSSLLFKPLPAGNVSQYRAQAKAPQGQKVIWPEEKGNQKVTPPRNNNHNQKVTPPRARHNQKAAPPRDNRDQKIAPPRSNHNQKAAPPRNNHKPNYPGRGHGGKPNPHDDEFWRKNGGRR
jgi:hypothetical protein